MRRLAFFLVCLLVSLALSGPALALPNANTNTQTPVQPATEHQLIKLTLVGPQGGETYKHQGYPNLGYLVVWKAFGLDGTHVKVTLLKNGQPAKVIMDNYPAVSGGGNDGFCGWMVTNDMEPGGDYKMEVRSIEHPTVKAVSQSNFTIAGVRVLAPNGGENWLMTQDYTIRWKAFGSGPVKILLFMDNAVVRTIADSASGDSYDWHIPNSLVGSAKYKVKIFSVSDTKLNDFSNNNFTIAPKIF